MIDYPFTSEQLSFRKTASDFAKKEIKPIIKDLDRVASEEEGFPWEVVKKGIGLGFTRMLISEEYGGLGLKLIDTCLVAEELAAADLGLAIVLLTPAALAKVIVDFGTEEQKERWLRPMCEDKTNTYLLAIGVNEPDAGGSESVCPIPDPEFGLRARARREGDDYILNGVKNWCTGSGVARLYGTLVRTDPTKPAGESLSIFFFPADTPGLSFGKIQDKMGLKAARTGEIIFEDMRVPKENLVGEVGRGVVPFSSLLSIISVLTGACAVGVARGAFEAASKYAKERITWGKEIIEHQSVAERLADICVHIEAARALAWKAAWTNDEIGFDLKLSLQTKIFCTEMAVNAAKDAMLLFGGYGYTREYPAEKFVRDALVGPVYAIPNPILRLLSNGAIPMGFY